MKKHLLFFIYGILCLPAPLWGDVIQQTEHPQGWILQTQNSTYQLAVASDDIVIPVYYGPTAQFLQVEHVPLNVNPKVGSQIREVPYRGGYVEMLPAVEVLFSDQVRDTHLVYQSSAILTHEGQPTLRIDLKDPQYGLRVSSYIRVFPEKDILEKWLVINNVGEDKILIENAQSGSIRLVKGEYELHHLSGTWGREFMHHKTRLTPGRKTIETRQFVAHNNPPWFAVANPEADETRGDVWFGGLAWSGNWRLDFEKDIWGYLQIIGGINFWDTTWTLAPNESFTTPKMVFGYSSKGLGGASHRMHEYVNKDVLRESFRDELRPVLYNSWYATTFHVNEEQQIALAKIAKEIGVELFVIDDGWFHGRKDDHAGLGDWWVDKEKFPNGLQPMIEKINDLGLDFGLWVEPEMVNPDSELFREHPDWAFHYPTRIRHEGRNQYMLNLARDEVCDYLYESLSQLLQENNIKFIKWDRNRALTDPGWSSAPREIQREARIRYTHNLYDLIERLQNRFPDVLFEVCSGGGGRNDLGIFSYMDQIWTSDNTDPTDRLFIQYGFSHAYPAKLMVGWITHDDWHQVEPSLEFRFHSSMTGVLGVGMDVTQWGEEEIQIAKQLIAQYKDIRPIVQEGILHRLISPFERNRVALQYVAEDASKSVVFLYNLLSSVAGSNTTTREEKYVRLRALDPDAMYEISGGKETTASGETLMNLGIPWTPRGSYKSTIIQLKKSE